MGLFCEQERLKNEQARVTSSEQNRLYREKVRPDSELYCEQNMLYHIEQEDCGGRFDARKLLINKSKLFIKFFCLSVTTFIFYLLYF
jgi:hypothetical protein